MQRFKSNTELIESIFERFREVLKMTLLIREMILRDEFDLLPDHLARREEKVKEIQALLMELEKVKMEVRDFPQIKKEIELIRDEILKIDAENADNIRERMKKITKELQELIERRKLLNYLR